MAEEGLLFTPVQMTDSGLCICGYYIYSLFSKISVVCMTLVVVFETSNLKDLQRI